MSFASKREFYAGGLVALIGAFAAYEGSGYGIGSVAQIESGFFPAVLGLGMILIGAAIAASGSEETGPAATGLEDPRNAVPLAVHWRGWFAIIAGVCLFMGIAEYAGLLPAIFACVFVSALGSTSTTLKEALVLAACVTAFGVVLFAFGLKIQIPILRGV
jgi:Tripartite tricarboxylate transporter TctB family